MIKEWGVLGFFEGVGVDKMGDFDLFESGFDQKRSARKNAIGEIKRVKS